MKIVYMGTPPFAVPPLRSLAAAGHEVAGVVTRTDKPAGRGKTLTPPAVKIAAAEMGIAVLQPMRIRAPEAVEALRLLAPDVIVVAAYGQILPPDVLTLPRLGCVNIHASLLPLYRGAAPVNWAVINGEQRTGITIMQMDEGMDTGAILLQEDLPIAPEDTAGGVLEKLSLLGSSMIVKALAGLEAGTLRASPQDSSRATVAPLLKKQDGLLDWTGPARKIHDRVRGLAPWPGAFTYLNGTMIKLLATTVLDGNAAPGSIETPDNDRLVAGTGQGLLRIDRLQPEGKKPMTAAEYLRGKRNIAGKRFTESTK